MTTRLIEYFNAVIFIFLRWLSFEEIRDRQKARAFVSVWGESDAEELPESNQLFIRIGREKNPNYPEQIRS